MTHDRFRRFASRRWFVGGCLVCIAGILVASPAAAKSPATAGGDSNGRNVLLVTLDGLRWQEVFGGADERLVSSDGGVKDIAATQKRFLSADASTKRETLMPFLWSTVAKDGVLFGDPEQSSSAIVTNDQHFSYPGYSEILCGLADERIDSNAKKYNENVTVLEWLHNKPEFKDRVAAFCSWDVFPYIINDQRSGMLVNAGWSPVANTVPVGTEHQNELQQLDQLADEVPHLWPGVRYDYFTFRATETYLRAKKPRVMFVSFGETDDWAHEGRYDLYLDSAQRNDDYLRRLWETIQSLPEYRDNTTLIITTDHGRGDARGEWTSHSKKIAGCHVIWVAVMGPEIVPEKPTETRVTQSQVAATVAAALGLDFAKAQPGVAAALPLTKLIKLEK